jgi:hypothetical protein
LGVFSRNTPSSNNGAQRSALSARAPLGTGLPANSVFLAPGVQPAQAVTYTSPRALTAAAVQINIADLNEAEMFRARRTSSSSVWQNEAWEYYDAIGEVKYAFNLVASVVSRIRLYVAAVQDPAEAPTPIRNADSIDGRLAAAAERALARLDSAYGGQAGMLKDCALNLQVAGECYLVQIPARVGNQIPESWDIRSVDELQADQKGNFSISPRREYMQGNTGNASSRRGVIPLPKNAFVGRIWRSHPRFSEEADSSLRGLLDLCAELLLLNRTFRATARSRLNAGALYLPDGLAVAASPDPNYAGGDEFSDAPTPEEMEDEFEDALIDAMTTPIRDEESASAVVPLIIRGPAELGDKIKQFKFERSFDPALAARSDRVLERILQGLDVPKDVVTGLANVKYSNALQIDEALYKAHIEPLMLLIADALTNVYLRPYLLANGFDQIDVNRIVVWYDPSQVATRNDRAEDADNGFDRMAVSLDTWRRAHGFSDQDAPDATELALRLLVEKGTISPELTEAMLNAVAPGVMDAAKAASQAANVAPLTPNIESALTGQPASSATPPAEETPIAPAADSSAPPVPLAEPTPSTTPTPGE